ncbi:MAG: hypothetical protein HON90_12950 [Halobacteriovoraceae bacterium]|nr:hypothetical protein [Halobacteriovoraceae bacterium]
MINYSVFKNFAFKFDPEFIHDVTIRSARALPNISGLFDSLVPDPKYQLSSSPIFS